MKPIEPIKFNSYTLVIALLISGGCSSPQIATSKQDALPNIVLILVDDLGKEWISCYGADDIVTPNIDALAASGTKFNNVYCMPQCTPSRVTLLTGQYPFRHGWVNHWDVPRWGGGAHFDETMNPSLGRKLQQAGYKTCIAGKWQIDDFRVEPNALINNGFDEYCMWTGYETGIEASAKRYQDPYLFTSEGSNTYSGQFGPDVFREFIEKFIRKNQDSTFFVYYPMVLTHTPFVNTPDEALDSNYDKHGAMVRYTDKIIGEIVKVIEELMIRDNTLIIVTTDNGTSGQITGVREGTLVKGAKSRTSEAGVSIPFIASWPGTLNQNSESDALIDFTDFYPTLVDLAENPPYETGLGKVIDGHSFKEVLTMNKPESKRSWIMSMGGGNYAQLTDQGVENQYLFRDRVIRNDRYKLYLSSQRQVTSFYDLQLDPSEMVNLLDSLNSDDRRENFEILYEVTKSFPAQDNDPAYKPNPPQPWDVEITAKTKEWKL